MLQQYQQGNSQTAPVDYAFNILNKVSQGAYTKWSIVYDITNRQIHFITNGNAQRRSISFSGLDFKCSTQARSVDINAPLKGNIAGNLGLLTTRARTFSLVRTSAEQSRSQLQITEKAIVELGKFVSTISCKQ